MPVFTTTRSDLKPTFVAKPDMRFGTTFISNKYRDYAVNGECLMDKATGEIFTKRPEDGRVVSFFQNKKYLHDLMLELRVMLNNNPEFFYPDETNLGAFYLSTDYDLMELYKEKVHDIMTNDTIISTTPSKDSEKLEFQISSQTNGFFCRMTTRDCDKSLVEWLTNQYNKNLKNYTGTNASFLAEKKKFTDIEKWEDSNAVLKYDLYVTKGGTTNKYQFTDYIRINEESCVMFPLSLDKSYFVGSESMIIKIKSITYDKLHFMLTNKAAFGPDFSNGIDKLIYPDKSILMQYCNICSYVDDVSDIALLGNEFLVALVDVPYTKRYMMKMSRLSDNSNIVLSPNKPDDDVWGTNGIWAEHIRDVFEGGYSVDLDCDVNIGKLEEYLSKSVPTYVMLSTDPTNKDSILGIIE